jgi:hypothetical protein
VGPGASSKILSPEIAKAGPGIKVDRFRRRTIWKRRLEKESKGYPWVQIYWVKK